MFQVSQSKVVLWRRCRYAYHLKYTERLSKKLRDRPLRFGILVHSAIDAIVHEKDPIKAMRRQARKERLFAEERELQKQEIATATTIVNEYVDYWKDKPLNLVEINGRRSEHPIETELVRGISFVGYVDNVARDGKLTFLVERKTGKDLPDESNKWRDLQTGIYALMWSRVYGKVDGILWDHLRSREPTRPQILKSGKLSTRDIDSLPSVVRSTIAENGLEESEYSELLAEQERNRANWFRRFRTTIHDRGLRKLFEDFVETAREVKRLDGRSKERTIGLHCGWCEFEKICRVALTSGSVRTVKEREYERRTKTRR